MRTVEYRSFNKASGEMSYGVMIPGETTTVVGDEVLMAYTNHHDGADKKIFEGDLIEFRPANPKKNKKYPLMMVFWNNQKARWSTKQVSEGTPEIGFGNITMSKEQHFVVGNIYENKDLLS